MSSVVGDSQISLKLCWRQLGFITCLFEYVFIIACLHWSSKAPMGSGQLRMHTYIYIHCAIIARQ